MTPAQVEGRTAFRAVKVVREWGNENSILQPILRK
jgi:hypothetical protein